MAEELSRKKRRETSKKPEKNKKKSRGLIKKTLIALLLLLAVGIVAGGITAFAIIRDAPPLDHDRLTLEQNPEILDREGEVITTLQSSENRRSADIEEVPQVMIDSVLAIEDARFYDHFGVDIRRLGGAVLANVRGGFGAEGASTITQQVVKNLFLDFDKTMTRKLQEQYLAVQMEQQYTKDQILEMYMNAIYFSDGRYGIVEASNYYFNKDLSELNIEDAALLAGIPQRPNAHNPFNHPEQAENRRNVVINQMVHYDKITEEEGEAAKAVPVSEQLEQTERDTNAYQSYIDQVLNEVEAIDGIESSDIYTGGLTIHTNLDQDLQSHVEGLIQSGEVIQFPDELMQAGVTVMDTASGEVQAIGGIREASETLRGYNWATNPSRSVGSTAKPIFSYGPAIDVEQWSTYEQIADEPYQYQTEDREVRNFDRSHRGDVSMREALRDSLNVPAVKALNEAGMDNSESFARGLGMDFETMNESFALGTNEASSMEMAGAYAAFGSGGVYNEPHTVTRVEFPDGQEIDLAPEGTNAMNDYTAYMVTDMLRDVITDGTAARMQMNGFDVAGKTGSSNFQDEDREQYGIPADADAIPDAWFVGYSPELTTSVWTGYPSFNDGYIDRAANEHHISQDLFQEVMNFAHDENSSSFTRPDSVIEMDIEAATGMLPSDFTPESEIIQELFVRGTEPGSVSEEFEIEEASGIQNLSASYNEASDSIEASWSFPEEELEFFNFNVEAVSDGSVQAEERTDAMSFSFTNPQPGSTYTIRVTPVDADDGSSAGDAAEVQVTIPDDELEEENENMEENNDNNNEPNDLNEEENANENQDNNMNNNNNGTNETDNEGNNVEAPEENTAEPENNGADNAPQNNAPANNSGGENSSNGQTSGVENNATNSNNNNSSNNNANASTSSSNGNNQNNSNASTSSSNGNNQNNSSASTSSADENSQNNSEAGTNNNSNETTSNGNNQ
ncbi:penicillin-binding protein 1A [Alkalicoccus chagannorensis]|uniref:penicillin-binding protein 1A n=1 Tax=Alkalicoccus chagannorensis TaxID=427072 RepID=UPI000403FE9D|nr:penicillin-binding protein 1A [Alkalicoccus chagannorensis]